MARKHEAVDWLKKGLSPSRIAAQMGVSVSTVMGYLYNQVGEGNIRRSDILFSIDADARHTVERLVYEQGDPFWRVLRALPKDVDRHDLEVYCHLRDARVQLGDMYEIIRDIEVRLHDAVRRVLITRYGAGDWWRKGIPENIRAECASSLERDTEPASEPYSYTNLIHLKEILHKRWDMFSPSVPGSLSRNKKDLLSRLARLNQIRNSVMHPVRGGNVTDRDFEFLRELRAYLNLEAWHD